MSRVGRLPIEVPNGVEFKLDGGKAIVKGPKGQLEKAMHPEIDIKMEDGLIVVNRPSEKKEHKALHGLVK